MGYWPVVLNVLKNSDVVLLITDARLPEISKNQGIIDKVEKMNRKRLIIVFNKTDLITRNEISKLKKLYPDSFLVSSAKKIGIGKLRESLQNMADNSERDSLRIGIVGYPNVGKSTLINQLVPNAKVKVSHVSGTTKKTEWIRKGNLRIMDSPGVIPFSDSKAKIAITSSKDPHKIKNPEKIAMKTLDFIYKKNSEPLEKFYKISAENPTEAFEKIAKKKGYLIKGGEIDENRTAIRIIDDWQKGKISLKS